MTVIYPSTRGAHQGIPEVDKYLDRHIADKDEKKLEPEAWLAGTRHKNHSYVAKGDSNSRGDNTPTLA